MKFAILFATLAITYPAAKANAPPSTNAQAKSSCEQDIENAAGHLGNAIVDVGAAGRDCKKNSGNATACAIDVSNVVTLIGDVSSDLANAVGDCGANPKSQCALDLSAATTNSGKASASIS